MKISKIFAAILLCLLVIAATSAYLAGKSRDAQEAAAIQEGTDVSGNSEDFAETEGGAEGEGDINAPETSAQEAAETEQTEEYGGELPIGDRVKVKGIYVTGNMAGTSNMDNLISLVDRTELNTMVIDIKNDEGRVVYQMDSPMVSELGSAQKLVADMPALVKKCREHGIYLIGRIVAFKDPFLAENRPELALHNQDGSVFRDKSGLAWVNPYSSEVWEYLMEIAAQAVAVGFDEIQFDYIRFSTDSGMSKVDFGPEAAGRDKEGTITEFTAYAAQALHQLGVPVSADVYGIIIDSELDASIVGQDYYEMAKYLDYIARWSIRPITGRGIWGWRCRMHSHMRRYTGVWALPERSWRECVRMQTGSRCRETMLLMLLQAEYLLMARREMPQKTVLTEMRRLQTVTLGMRFLQMRYPQMRCLVTGLPGMRFPEMRF